MEELENVLAIPREEVILASAKEGTGVADILEAIVARIPAPKGDPHAPGPGAHVRQPLRRVQGRGRLRPPGRGHAQRHDAIRLMASGAEAELLELGVFRPQLVPVKQLVAGEVGYVATGLKNVREAQVGDTVTTRARPATEPLPGYQEAKSLVFAGLYPVSGEDYPLLRDALEKLHLNDAELHVRAGELGRARVRVPLRLPGPAPHGDRPGAPGARVRPRPHRLGAVGGVPRPPHTAGAWSSSTTRRSSPTRRDIESIEEPWVKLGVVTPDRYIGALMELSTEPARHVREHGVPGPDRVVLHFELPLAELIVDYYDQLKSRTQGYASMDYEEIGYRAGEPRQARRPGHRRAGRRAASSSIAIGRRRPAAQLAEKLKELIPRQMFEVPIQAAIGSHVIARETIRAMRKNVLAKCYGGDITRKRKLLEKQKEGKQRMKRVGSVEIPQEAFLAMLRMGEG